VSSAAPAARRWRQALLLRAGGHPIALASPAVAQLLLDVVGRYRR
jgi:hypothetical protein